MESTLQQQKKPHDTIRLVKATYGDEATVVNILTKSFVNDPHLKWMLAQSRNPNKLKILMSYMFHETIRIGNIYLTEDKTATALWKSEKQEKFTFEYVKRNLGFLFKIGVKTVYRILSNEKYTHDQYPTIGKYCQLYIIGVLPQSQGKGYASSLMNPVLEEMDQKSIPVYLETANAKNVPIYRKKGFTMYNTWFKKGLQLFYMRRELAGESLGKSK